MLKYGEVFKKAVGMSEAAKLREFKTTDIVKRLGVISPDRVYLNNFPVSNPIAVFNPSITIHEDEAIIYARMIIGYYMYVSAIIKVDVPLEDIYTGNINLNYYASLPVIYPSTKYDLWGTEDPRVYSIDNNLYMTYTGRTVNYFNPAIRRERTLPLTAVRTKNFHTWKKAHVYVLPKGLREHVISDKDAFLAKMHNKIVLFHRPHMDDEIHYLLVSKVDHESLKKPVKNLEEVEVHDATWILNHSPFEEKIGWATPPITLNHRELIVLIHAVDTQIQAYRLFALQLELSKDEEIIVKAVTPSYIMEPKLPYEIFGDRPYTIFPCGICNIGGDKVLMTYGAGDYMIGIGEIDVNELLSLLDKGRIY